MPGVKEHTWNPSIWEAETGTSKVSGQPEQQSKTLPPKTNKSGQVVRAFILATQKADIHGSQFRARWGKMLLDLISTKKCWTCWQEPVFTATQEA
jgi:hypothetical protein